MMNQLQPPTGPRVPLCIACGSSIDPTTEGEIVHRVAGGFLTTDQVDLINAGLVDGGAPKGARVDDLCPTCLVHLMADLV